MTTIYYKLIIMLDNNILYVLLAILPAIIYSVILYKFIPSKMIGGHRTRRYLSASFISPILVLFVHYLFPNIWTKFPFIDSEISKIITCFLEIALVEELIKYITYSWVTSHRKNHEHDYPIATLFYCMMCSVGFAIVENIYYLINWGEGILFIRSITAVIIHMTCGIIMGYFIALSKLYTLNKENKISYLTYNPIRKIYFIVIGLISSIFLHGLYDYSITIVNQNHELSFITDFIIITGLIVSIFLSKSMIKISKQLKKDSSVKELEL